MTLKMRPSRVLAKLRAGQVVNCFKLNLCDARAIEIAAMAGFDCLWTCMEHVPNDLSAIEKGIWASKCYNVDMMVRVPRGSYSNHIYPLEMDATGIMVPHVMSLADAKNVVHMTRFHPIGRRAADGGNADGAYCGINFIDYIKQANEQRFVVVQIEDPEPMADLDAIAALPGIDMLFFGPGDFSHGIGAPAVWDHPRLIEARKQVAAAARAHGKFAGTMASPANMEELIAMGYRFLNLGADVVGLAQYCNSVLANFTKSPAAASTSIYGGQPK